MTPSTGAIDYFLSLDVELDEGQSDYMEQMVRMDFLNTAHFKQVHLPRPLSRLVGKRVPHDAVCRHGVCTQLRASPSNALLAPDRTASKTLHQTDTFEVSKNPFQSKPGMAGKLRSDSDIVSQLRCSFWSNRGITLFFSPLHPALSIAISPDGRLDGNPRAATGFSVCPQRGRRQQ